MIRLSLLPPEHENDNMHRATQLQNTTKLYHASIQVVLTMFAQDAATAQPPRPWRMYLLMALKSWTIFSERSLDAKLELLLPTQKTSANSENIWFADTVLSLPPPVLTCRHGSNMMIVISIMQALFSLSLCVAIIQMNTPKHYCRCVAIV